MPTFMMMGVGGETKPAGGGGGGSTTTWNPADKGANITLSNGNLTEAGSANTDNIVRATTSETAGKWYWEVTANGGSGAGPGLISLTSPLATFLGNPGTKSAGYYPSGLVYSYAGSPPTLATYSGTHNIGVAWDEDNQLLWFRLDGGNWNNNVVNDPSTGVGGMDVSITAHAAQAPAGAGKNTTDIVTANFGASAFSFTAPSGFSTLP